MYRLWCSRTLPQRCGVCHLFYAWRACPCRRLKVLLQDREGALDLSVFAGDNVWPPSLGLVTGVVGTVRATRKGLETCSLERNGIVHPTVTRPGFLKRASTWRRCLALLVAYKGMT